MHLLPHATFEASAHYHMPLRRCDLFSSLHVSHCTNCFAPLPLVQSLHLDRECFTPLAFGPITSLGWRVLHTPCPQSVHLDRACFTLPPPALKLIGNYFKDTTSCDDIGFCHAETGVFAKTIVLNTCSACSPLVGRASPHSRWTVKQRVNVSRLSAPCICGPTSQ